MNCNTVYFSPTYTTQKVIRIVSEIISADISEFDITHNFTSIESLSFGKKDFVIVGIPVYSGRVPMLARKIISHMRGDETPVALIATYGNRHYDDSLLELKTIVEANGFLVVAAAAFVTEHSVVQRFGKGRPDNEDLQTIKKFAKLLQGKLATWSKENHSDLTVKGNSTYREYKSIPIKPHVLSSCAKCGLCVKKCPANAIPLNNPKKTLKDKCVTCMRCVRICPNKSRTFYWFEKLIAERSLARLCEERKQPEIFV